MRLQQGAFPGLLLLAGLALWLLLAGPSRVLGIDTGHAGMVLLVTTAWLSLLAVRMLPRGDAERAASPGEWRARIGTVFMAVAMGYMLSKAQVFHDAALPFDPAMKAVAGNLVLLLVAWIVLSKVLASRWQGQVQEDERDRGIERQARDWGRGALVAAVIGIAVTLAFSPADRLQWASHLAVANTLVFALMAGWLVEYAAAAVAYWRDRH